MSVKLLTLEAVERRHLTSRMTSLMTTMTLMSTWMSGSAGQTKTESFFCLSRLTTPAKPSEAAAVQAAGNHLTQQHC